MSLEFKYYKINDIGEVVSGGTPSTSKNEYWYGDIGWITPKDLSSYDDIYISRGERNISSEGLNNSSAKLVPKNTVLMTSRAPIGYIAIANNELSTNQGFKSLICNEKICHYKYFYYWLKLNIKYIINNSNGSTFKEISGGTFKNLELSLPSLNEQKAISSVLWTIDEKISVLKRINKNLEQLMKCIFEDWFVNFNYSEDISFKSSELGEIPSNWNVKKLSDVLITLESGKRPKGGISDIEDGIPSIGAENILGLGKFNYSKNKLISHEFFSTLKKGVIQDKDVLLYKDGAQLGRKSLFMKGFPFDICCINEHVFRLQTNDEINQFYLYLWLDQEVMTNEIINLNSNSAQPGINQNDVKSLLILVPELKIISKFNKIISPMMNQIFDNALEINKLTKLRDTLLPKLMSGEIDVSKINCDLKIIIRKIYIKSSKLFLWRYLSENKNYIKNTKSNETLLKSRTIYKINKFLAKFNARYRYYRQ